MHFRHDIIFLETHNASVLVQCAYPTIFPVFLTTATDQNQSVGAISSLSITAPIIDNQISNSVWLPGCLVNSPLRVCVPHTERVWR